MQLRPTLIAICWIAWVLTWIVTAIVFRPERHDPSSPPRRSRSRPLGIRLVMGVFVLAAIETHQFGHAPLGPALGWAGVVICAAGFGFATWARVYLGRNWGLPMTVRAEPRLVRGGPYRVVRHPIYTGLVIALIGSALADGSGWFVVLIGALAYFVVCMRVEEADMTALFPDEYPEYAAHTRRLIPHVY